jgi:hypothetical protein
MSFKNQIKNKKSHGGEIPWLISQENGSQTISKQGVVTMVRE